MHPNVIKSNPHDRGTEGVIHNVERRAYSQQKAEADRWHAKEAPPPWETTPPAPPVTQEQRDEATAIAQVQGKKRRKTSKRTAAKRTPSKRMAKRTASKRMAPKRQTRGVARAKRTSAKRSGARKKVTRRRAR